MTTWGIDGPTFLAIHTGAVAAISAVAVLAERRWGAPADRGELDEYETAYLTGGVQLAAVVALVNLDRRGAIDLGDDLLRDLHESGDLDLDVVRDAGHLASLGVELHVTMATGAVAASCVRHPVEAAALQAVRGTKPATPWRVLSATTRMKAMGRVKAGLVERGLLHDADGTERIRRRWRWLLPMAAVAAARAVVAAEGLVALLVVVLAMWALSRRRPRNTRAGDGLVADLRRRRPELLEAPAATGPSAGIAVALAGTAVLWSADPALALAVDAPADAAGHGWRESARDWWHSSGYGGGWSGGAGWGGGGDGSSGCGGGGGGGCGGGGGGCGGGG